MEGLHTPKRIIKYSNRFGCLRLSKQTTTTKHFQNGIKIPVVKTKEVMDLEISHLSRKQNYVHFEQDKEGFKKMAFKTHVKYTNPHSNYSLT